MSESKPKFTPGPWEVVQYDFDDGWYVRAVEPPDDFGEYRIAELISQPTGEADALLIAAAPDLYAALKSIHDALLSDPPDGGPQKHVGRDDVIYRLDARRMYVAINAARAALAKAKPQRGAAQ